MKKSNIFKDLKSFLVLLTSQSVSTLGTVMTGFALIIFAYEQDPTATTITMLTVTSLLPSILLSFIAGTLSDRLNKKLVMLICDSVAAMATLLMLVLFLSGRLKIPYIYIINFLLSVMNAFKAPASYVATTLLVPKEQYVRASGLSEFYSSVVTILAPVFAGTILTFGGLAAVLILDLISFLFAFSSLFFFIKIPNINAEDTTNKESLIESCKEGFRFLANQKALFRIILFFAFINFIAKMGGYGMLPAFILARTSGEQLTLSIVQSAVGLGTLIGSVLVTLAKPAKSRTRVIFLTCGISFLIGDIGQGLSHSLPLLAVFGLLSNLPLPFLSANLTAIMRTKVPTEMQGRVFSARDTLQYGTMPIGLALAGILADRLFEPFMTKISLLQQLLAHVFGSTGGSGIAVMFVIVGIIGSVSSFLCLANPVYRQLDHEPSNLSPSLYID
ncbi:MAG: MFS transporter [Oscillospiraceae bacterium]|nr:MFS transporter [Oscillospiraceae bacterium]